MVSYDVAWESYNWEDALKTMDGVTTRGRLPYKTSSWQSIALLRVFWILFIYLCGKPGRENLLLLGCH